MQLAIILLFWCHSLIGSPSDRFQTEKGYELTVDTDQVSGPTGIALLPRHVRKNTTTRYLVTELRGDIKYVNESGQAHLFANSPNTYQPSKELPDLGGEIGQIGACLSPDAKELFVTSVTTIGITRVNRLQVWRSQTPDRWQRGQLDRELVELFAKSPAHNPHQIGYCLFDPKGNLVVGTGDGAHHRTTHLRDYPNGKILRMKRDFSATTTNPFYTPETANDTASYVYASGLRNPFAIAVDEQGQIYVADNGPNVDRLLAVAPGRDYPWDNSNESFTYGNIMTWTKSIGPAGMVFVPHGSKALPDLGGHLVVAASYERAIYAIPVANGEVVGKTKKLVASASEQHGALTGLALNEEGLYIAYMEISQDRGFDGSAIFKLRANEFSTAGIELTGEYLFDQRGCRGCHMLSGQGSPIGPALDNVIARVTQRLQSKPYLDRIKKQANEANSDIKSYAQTVSDTRLSVDQRVEAFIHLKILAPKLDNSESGMAALEIPTSERSKLIAYLIDHGNLKQRPTVKEDRWSEKIKWFFKQRPNLSLTVMLALGIFLGIILDRSRPLDRSRSKN